MAGRTKAKRGQQPRRLSSRFQRDMAIFYRLVHTVNKQTNKGDELLLTTESYNPEHQNRLTGLTELIVREHPPQPHITLGEFTVSNWIDKQRREVKAYNKENPHDQLPMLGRVTNSNVKTAEQIKAEKEAREAEKKRKWRAEILANIPLDGSE